MFTYKAIPTMLDEKIREKFKDFNYELPVWKEEKHKSNDDKINYEKYVEIAGKIFTTTGYSYHMDFNKILETKTEDKIGLINVLEEVSNDSHKRLELGNFIEKLNNIYMENKDNYEYIYINYNIDLEYETKLIYNNDGCIEEFYFTIYGVRDETIEEYNRKVKLIDMEAERRLIEIREQQAKKEKEKNLEGLKSFADNYDKHKKQIDYLCDQINDGLMSLGDLDNYGNIGIWTRIKVRNLG